MAWPGVVRLGVVVWNGTELEARLRRASFLHTEPSTAVSEREVAQANAGSSEVRVVPTPFSYRSLLL